MSRFGKQFDNALDRHITGNYGEYQLRNICPICDKVFYHDNFEASNGQLTCSQEHKNQVEAKL